jgi:hypothetical protein
MGGFSWIRIFNFSKLLYDLETKLDLVELKKKLKIFLGMKRLFSRKNTQSSSIGEKAISGILVFFYASTLYWIFLT